MSTRTRSWRHRLMVALVVALAATLGALADAEAALADGVPCQEYVTIFKSDSGGAHSGEGTATYNPGQININTRNPAWSYVAFGGVTRPRRPAYFRFTDEAGNLIWFNGRGGVLTNEYRTTDSGDNWVIRQEWNVLPWSGLIAQAGRKLHVYADFHTRCGGDDVKVFNRYVGSVVTFPAAPVTVDPKYLVVGVTYAPPGSASFVEYGSSTTLGARLSISQSFQTGVTESTTVTARESIGTETSFKQKSQDSVSLTVEKSETNSIIIPGPASSLNGIDHNQDKFFLWLNPRYTIIALSPTSMETGPLTNDPADPVSPNMDIVEVSVAQLKNPSTIPAGTASRLQRSWSITGALNQDDFNAILARNPFANGGTAIDPQRFDLLPGSVFDYSPATPGGQPTTRRHTVRFQEALTQGISSTITVNTKITGPEESVNILKFALKNSTSESFEFTATTSLDLTQAQNQTTTLSLTGPTSGYQGPTAVQVYQDNIYGTLMFAFAPIPTFQIGAPSPNQTVTQGGSAAFPLTTQSDFGFTGNIDFASVMGLPAGATASFSPASVAVGNGSTLTVTTTEQTPPGMHPLTITATSGLINRHLTVNLVVNPKPFTLSVTPSTRVLSSGQSTTYAVTVTPAAGFTGPVQLSGPGGLPPGASATFSPSTLTGGGGTSTLTVTTSASTPSGTSTLTITATGGSLTQTAPVSLVVDNVQDFGLAVTPQAAGVAAGDTATYTVTTTAINGFTGNVNLTVSGLPSGTNALFSVNPIAGAGSSTLSIATATSTPSGDYNLTITGTSGSIAHTQSVTLSVSPPVPDFALMASPGSQSAPPGQSTTYAVSTASIGGFTGGIGLSVTGLPTGVTATFSPATVSPGSGSTLTVSVSSGVAPGSYQLTVRGTSGSLTHSQNVTLTVTGAPAILGYNQIGGLVDVGDMNYMNGSRYVTGSNAMTISTIAVYMTAVQPAPNNQYQVAIYTDVDGRPGTLVASSTSGTLVPDSWNTRPVSATLAPNTAYWLMYNTNGDNNVSYDTANLGDGSWSSNSQPFGTWPSTFGPATMSHFKISVYAY